VPVVPKAPSASVLGDVDKAKPVFSTTRLVATPAPTRPKVVKTKAR
jgi:hypothetical protein